jgi:hypothetical protein
VSFNRHPDTHDVHYTSCVSYPIPVALAISIMVPMASSTPSGILPIPDRRHDTNPDEYLDNPPGVIGKERSNACIGTHALQLGYRKEGKELCCSHEHKPFHPGKPHRPRPWWMDTGHTTGVHRQHYSCNGCFPLTHSLLSGKGEKELCCNVEHKGSLLGKPSLRSWPRWMDTGPTSVHPRQPSRNGCLRLPHTLPTGKVGKELCLLGYSSALTPASDVFLFASGCSTPGALFSAPGMAFTFPSSYAIYAF